MIPLEHAYMLGFTVFFLVGTLGVALFALARFHRRIS